MKVFFSAGEPSGDVHGANLIRQLRAIHPDLEAVGYGGPEMAAAGCQLHTDLTALAVMWILRVIINIHRFLGLASEADRYFRYHRPDAVVLIDYPGFNWWIAWRAKLLGIPVFYYAPPQIWAWASWRIKKMRRYVDHVLAALPFEAEWFAAKGCNATFVGHPYFDEVRRHEFDENFIASERDDSRPLITILPGSRTQEVHDNLPEFLRAAAHIQRRIPTARFAIAAFKPHQARIAREMLAASGVTAEVFVRRTPELIRLADACMATSGSVSLELLYQAKPTVVLYKIGRLAFRIQKIFRRVKYITLVNLLNAEEIFPEDLTPYDPSQPTADLVLFPEYLTCEDRSEHIAGHVCGWLERPAERARLVAKLKELRTVVSGGGASGRAASYIVETLTQSRSVPPRPHFLPSAQRVQPSTPARPRQFRRHAA